MQLYALASEKSKIPESTQEMKDWFDKRTKKHISLVQKYCKKVEGYDKERFNGLIERGKVHDQSKLENPEKDPYVWITWSYKCKEDGKKFEGPDNIKELMSQATEHHVKSNRHHPECTCKKEVALINREDRDKPPKEMIDASNMNDLDVGEMCADWMAMSEEKSGTPKDWADKNINIRWKFTDKQKDLIYELIDNIWE